MITFREFLEERANAAFISAGQNTAIAAAGEHLTTAHILKKAAEVHKTAGNNSRSQYLYNKGVAHQQQAQKLLNNQHPQVTADVVGRSKRVADSFIQHHESEGRPLANIHDIHHTPKGGDIGIVTGAKTNQTDDPSDMVAHYKTGGTDDFQGISYKNNKSSTLGTPGSKATDASLGTKHEEIYGKFQSDMKKKYGDNWKTKEGRRELEKKPEVKAEGKKFTETAAEHTHKTFTSAKPEVQREHLKKMFKMNPKIPYVLAKGYGSGGSYGASISKHDDNEKGHAINNAPNFSSERRGSSVHYFAHTKDGQKHHLGYSEHRFTHSGFSSFGLPSHSK